MVSIEAAIILKRLTHMGSCTCGTYFSRTTIRRIGLEALVAAISSKSSDGIQSEVCSYSVSSLRGEVVARLGQPWSQQDGLKNVRWKNLEGEDVGSFWRLLRRAASIRLAPHDAPP